MKTIFILIIAFLSIYASCNKRSDCSQTDYSFEGNFKAFPDRDSIRINDTIWLEAKIPVQLKNMLTGEIVNYSGAVNLGTAIQYLELISGVNDPAPLSSASNFENQLKKGVMTASVDRDLIREFLFAEENGFYLFKLAIIPKKRGLFVISPGNAGNVYTQNNKCRKAGFRLTFKDTDQHIYLYEQNRPGYTVSGYERGHMYVFKVY